MNVWDAELLMAKKPAEMVTDGLIMWIDGRDAPSNTKAIKERITNSYLNVSGNNLNFSLSQSSDGLYLNFTTGASAYALYYFANGSSAQTIEYVSSPDSLYGYAMGYGSKELIYVSRNYTGPPLIRGVVKSTTSNTNIYFYPQSYPKHIVVRSDSIMYDGHKEPASGVTYQTAFNNALIINAWSGHLQKIGAIRAYNRVLSDDEVLQNLAYEKSIGRA